MRIATYNIEWFNALFDDDGGVLDDAEWSSRYNITRADQIAAIGKVMTALNADGIMIIEAPDQNGRRSSVKALENFARLMGLRARKAVIGFENETQQEIAFLYDPDAMSVVHDPIGAGTGKRGSRDAPRFDGAFRIDLDFDATEDVVRFSKPPLELAVEAASGAVFRLIGVHLKSKAPRGANTKDQVMRLAIANRRKQLAQCIWLRERVGHHVAAGDPLILLGDLNDGPGLDEFEQLFGRSGVEIVMGTDLAAAEQLYDPNAARALQSRLAAQPATARFFLREESRYLSALLDYIMVCPLIRPRTTKWRIWHPFDDPVCWREGSLCQALLTSSDHFPVSMQLSAEPAPQD